MTATKDIAGQGPPPVATPAQRASLGAGEFQVLLAQILPAAYGYALRLARSRADAEDLVQEAALNAFRGQRGFEAGTNFKAWYFRILTNCFWSKRRQDQRRPRSVDLDDTPDLYLYTRSAEHGLPQDGADPASLLLDRIGTGRVVEAIAQLPEEFRVASILYFMEDFTYHEIAEILGVPVGTIRSRLHRGRKMLQKTLWQGALEAGIVSAREVEAEAEVDPPGANV